MRYSSYKIKYASKIKKLNLLYKLRFVFVGIGATAVVATTTGLGVKGSVGQTTPSKATYVYGEEVDVLSSAFMNDYYIEYAHKDASDWSTDKPVKPGDYQARGVSKNGYGKSKYGKNAYFEIVPAELSLPITSTKITYGETPIVDFSEATKKNLKINSVDFLYGTKFDESDPFDGKASFKENVSLKKEGLDIIDANGQNLNDCYKVISEPKEMDVNKREIVINVFGKEKSYDEQALTTSEYELHSDYTLAFNDEIKASNPSSITEIGEEKADFEFKVMNGDVDKTAFYDIKVNKGNLVINKRSVQVSTNSINRLYNGRRLSKDATNEDDKLEYTIIGDGILEDHHIDFQGFELEGTYITSGSVENKIQKAKFNIVDKDGNSVESYYKINFTFGLVNLAKRSLVLNFKNVTEYYDENRTELVGGYEISGDNKADTDEITTGQLIKDASIGSVLYGQKDLITIHNSVLDEDVQDSCYKLVANTATLQIKKRTITFHTNDVKERIYDGDPLSSEEDAESKDKLYGWIEGELAPGHKLVTDFDLDGHYVTSGQVQNTATYDIVDDNNVSYKDSLYYEVLPEVFGHVNVKKLELTVTFDSSNRTYTGDSFDISYTKSKNIPSCDTLKITDCSISAEAGDHLFTPNVTIEDKNGNDVTSDYYSLQVNSSSSIHVNKRSLVVHTHDASHEYDGQPFSSSSLLDDNDKHKLTFDCQGLAPGHKLINVNFDYDGGAILCGEYTNYLDVSSFRVVEEDHPENDVTSNYYQPEVYCGTLRVTKKPISITYSNLKQEVDGSYLMPSYTHDALVGGDTLYCPHTDSWVPGQYTQYVRIYNSVYEDVTSCYDISNPGYTAIIEKRNVTILSNSFSKIYDGYGLVDGAGDKELKATATNLMPGHTLRVVGDDFDLYETRNVNLNSNGQVESYSNTFSYQIMNGLTPLTSDEIKSYYNITVLPGTVTINKRAITVVNSGSASNRTYYYSAKGLDVNDGDIELSGNTLGYGDFLIRNKYEEVGQYSGQQLFGIVDGDGYDTSYNYDVTVNTVYSLTINKIHISYCMNTGYSNNTYVKTYDASPVPTDMFVHINSDPLPTGYSVNIEINNDTLDLIKYTPNPVKYDYELVVRDNDGNIVSGQNLADHFVIEKDTSVGDAKYQIDKKNIYFDNGNFGGTYSGSVYTRNFSYSEESQLATGDYFSSFNLSNQTNQTNGQDIAITENSPIKITNSSYVSNDDRTNCYNFEHAFGSYNVTKRPIKIVMNSFTARIYNGIKISDSEINSPSNYHFEDLGTNTGLIIGHKLTLSAKDVYKKVTEGAVEYDVNTRITDSSNKDVTDNYQIIIQKGTYQIDKRPIQATAVSLNKVFDGYTYNYKQLENQSSFNSNLCSGHKAELTFLENLDTYNVGERSNPVGVEIYDKNNNNECVTDQYAVTTEPGKITITPRVITYQIVDKEFTYNGSNQTVQEDINMNPNDNKSIPSYVKIINWGGGNSEGFLENDDMSITASFEYTGHYGEVTENSSKTSYSFYKANTTGYYFEGVIICEIGGVEYRSDSGATDTNVVFTSAYDSELQYIGKKRTATMTTAELKKYCFYGQPTQDIEQIYVSNLASGDSLYIGGDYNTGDKYTSTTTEYALLPFNGDTSLERGMTYSYGSNFTPYLSATDSSGNYTNLRVYRKVNNIMVDVTDCYNFSFKLTDSIIVKIVG